MNSWCLCDSDLFFPPSVWQLNPAGLLTMPRSPTSSEDEMAQSFSDYSDDCASDSSREETIYETIRATAEPSQSRMDDIHINSLVVRVLIPDLQQTVSICDTNVERVCDCVVVDMKYELDFLSYWPLSIDYPTCCRMNDAVTRWSILFWTSIHHLELPERLALSAELCGAQLRVIISLWMH